jgi:DNA-binding transcriptional LysR family regulator
MAQIATRCSHIENMELSDIRIFSTVAATGGVNAAARALGKAPSNVTLRVQRLEHDLGQALFHREGRRLRLSPAGRTFLAYAERLLGLAGEARDALGDETPRGAFRLGALENVAALQLPVPLARYHRRYPAVTIELVTGPADALCARVLAGELEAAVVVAAPVHRGLEAAPLWKEPSVIIAPAGHRPIRTSRDLAGLGVLAFASGCTYRRRMETWLGRGSSTVPIMELGSHHAILACVAAGMGVALVPQGLLTGFPGRAALSEHPLPASETLLASLVWKKPRASARVRALREILSAETSPALRPTR